MSSKAFACSNKQPDMLLSKTHFLTTHASKEDKISTCVVSLTQTKHRMVHTLQFEPEVCVCVSDTPLYRGGFSSVIGMQMSAAANILWQICVVYSKP